MSFVATFILDYYNYFRVFIQVPILNLIISIPLSFPFYCLRGLVTFKNGTPCEGVESSSFQMLVELSMYLGSMLIKLEILKNKAFCWHWFGKVCLYTNYIYDKLMQSVHSQSSQHFNLFRLKKPLQQDKIVCVANMPTETISSVQF